MLLHPACLLCPEQDAHRHPTLAALPPTRGPAPKFPAAVSLLSVRARVIPPSLSEACARAHAIEGDG
eukprot:2088071-Pleurochrysis_carterae.AAC.2